MKRSGRQVAAYLPSEVGRGHVRRGADDAARPFVTESSRRRRRRRRSAALLHQGLALALPLPLPLPLSGRRVRAVLLGVVEEQHRSVVDGRAEEQRLPQWQWQCNCKR